MSTASPTLTQSNSSSNLTRQPTTPAGQSTLSNWFNNLSISQTINLLIVPPAYDYFSDLAGLITAMQATNHPDLQRPNVQSITQSIDEAAISALATISQSSISQANSELNDRQKRQSTYRQSSIKKKQKLLIKMIADLKKLIFAEKTKYESANQKCDANHYRLLGLIDRLRSYFLIDQCNLLTESVHLIDELFENYEHICKVNIVSLKSLIDELQAALDELIDCEETNQPINPQKYPYLLPDTLFASGKSFSLLNPQLPDLFKKRSELEMRLKQIKEAYLIQAKLTADEELIPRFDRINQAVNQFFDHYNGDCTADYSPARSIEYDFSKLCMDERTKQGQHIAKMLKVFQAQADQLSEQLNHHDDEHLNEDSNQSSTQSVTPSDKTILNHDNILHFIRKFESNLAAEFSIEQSKRLFLRLMIQRMLFPRLWPICSIYETSLGQSSTANRSEPTSTDELDAHHSRQVEWLRWVRLDQLGITTPFLMPDSIKQELSIKHSMRWKKSDQTNNQPNQSNNQAHIPAQLPAALASLLQHQTSSHADNQSNINDQSFDQSTDQSIDQSNNQSLNDQDDQSLDELRRTQASPASSDDFDRMIGRSDTSNATNDQSSNQSENHHVNQSDDRSNQSISQQNAHSDGHIDEQSQVSNNQTINQSNNHPINQTNNQTTSETDDLASSIDTLKSMLPPPPKSMFRPYVSCIDCMEDMSQLQAPLDQLQCLLAVARNIYKTATEYSLMNCGGSSCELGADSFFPIFVYTLIHADVPDIHRRMRFMQQYGMAKTSELAEHGYYLTCLEGGLMFITQAKPQTFIEMLEREQQEGTR